MYACFYMASETTRDSTSHFMDYTEGLIQNICNSSALAMGFISLELIHWGRVIHICVSKLTIIASVNGLSPSRHQAIIWTNAEIMLIEALGTNFSEILIEIHPVSLKKMQSKISSGKWGPFCLSLNVLNNQYNANNFLSLSMVNFNCHIQLHHINTKLILNENPKCNFSRLFHP